MFESTPIETPRLRLRQWTASDRGPFAELNADPVVMEHYPRALRRSESDVCADHLQTHLATQGWGLWAVEVRVTGEFLGYTGLARPSFEARFRPAVEIGWRLKRTAWGHGYATEAARAAAAYGFANLGLAQIVSFTSTTNLRSQAVMRRLGMTHDPADDFDHPLLPLEDPLRRHVLFRLARPAPADESTVDEETADAGDT